MASHQVVDRHVSGEKTETVLLTERLFLYSGRYMYYTYVLRSRKDQKLYIGYTEDLKRRFIKHQCGQVVATKPRRPLDLIFYEAYSHQKDALRREQYLKTDKGKKTLELMLRDFFSSTCIA